MTRYKSDNASTLNLLNSLSSKFFASLFILSFIFTTDAQINFRPLLGNYNSQPRINGHINSERLLSGLKSLGANTYMFLINGENDWADFKAFLPKAKKAGITVWPYLRPPSETPATGYDGPYSEPYKSDYIGWAKAIARLSLGHSNLVGYVIDDFWYNTPSYEHGTKFSTSYIKKMVMAGKSINPNIKFYPLLYFRQIDMQFIDSLSTLIDGVVAAYPGQIKDKVATGDSLAIVKALNFTNAIYQIILASIPEKVSTSKGDNGFAYRYVKVTDPANVVINLSHFSDRAINFGHYPFGYHKIQLRIDDKIIWSRDVVDSNGIAGINLSNALTRKDIHKLSIGVYNNSGVTNYYVHTKLQIVSMKGIEYVTPYWAVKTSHKYNVSVLAGNKSLHLPLIVMPAGNISQYLKRYADPATPQNIAKRIRTITQFLKTGQIEGIVTFALDMNNRSDIFQEVRNIYKLFWIK